MYEYAVDTVRYITFSKENSNILRAREDIFSQGELAAYNKGKAKKRKNNTLQVPYCTQKFTNFKAKMNNYALARSGPHFIVINEEWS